MDKLDYNKIITYEDLLSLNENDKNTLMTISSIEANKLNSNNPNSIINYDNRHLIVREIVNTGLYKDFPKLHKEIIATEIIYDTEKIIKLLLRFGIDYTMIESFAIRLSELKNIQTTYPNCTLSNSKYYYKIMSIIKKICFLIKNEFKGQDDYLIINKLICISAFYKELYLKLQEQDIKKPQ